MSTELFDLEEAVEDWAWEEYKKTASQEQVGLKEKGHVGLQIDWSDVKFRDKTIWPSLTEEELSESKTTGQTTSATEEELSKAGTSGLVDAGQTTGASLRPTSSKTYSSVLFQTKFYNNTDDSQQYSLKAERTTTSTCEVSLEHGFTRGRKMSVTLKSPVKILEARAGYQNGMALTNSAGQTSEEKMIWSVDSLITVKGKHVAEASLGVQEKQFSGDYEIKTQVWGYVFVTFNRRKNNVQIKAIGHDISEVIRTYLETEKENGKAFDYVKLHETKPMVTITTKGKCRFRFGTKQEIKVDQTPLGSA